MNKSWTIPPVRQTAVTSLPCQTCQHMSVCGEGDCVLQITPCPLTGWLSSCIIAFGTASIPQKNRRSRVGSLLSNAQRVYSKLPPSDLEVHLSSALSPHFAKLPSRVWGAAFPNGPAILPWLVQRAASFWNKRGLHNTLWKHSPLLHSSICWNPQRRGHCSCTFATCQRSRVWDDPNTHVACTSLH